MKKYEVVALKMKGTGIEKKKGEFVELSPNSEKTKSLLERGWIKEVSESKAKPKPKDEPKDEPKDKPKDKPKK